MSVSFILPGFGYDVPVILTPDITAKQLQDFPAFRIWTSTLKANLERGNTNAGDGSPFKLRSITIQSVDWFTPTKIGFIKFIADVRSDKTKLPGIVFLRGGSVAALMILRPRDSRDERLVVMTEQPRIPAGSLSFLEIPAGMIDDGTFSGTAAKEIKEETGFTIPESELINMTELALKKSELPERDTLQNAMYPSPGGSDEFIPIFLWEKELDRQEIEDLRGKLTGTRRRGEMITLRLCEYEYLWREGVRDAKTLAAWALYEGLNCSGALREEIQKRRRNHRGDDSAK